MSEKFTPETEARIAKAIECANDAFWNVIAAAFPEATSGDLAPDAELEMSQGQESIVKTWLQVNAPRALFPVGSYVRYTPADLTSPRNMLAVVHDDGVEAIDPEDRDALMLQNTSPFCDWINAEFIEHYPALRNEDYADLIYKGEKLSREARAILLYRSTLKLPTFGLAAGFVIDLHEQRFEEF